MIIEKVMTSTKNQLKDEQGVFRRDMVGADQVWLLKIIGEKYLEKSKDLYVAFIDFEKVYA